jgi:hypothetical protein
VDTTVYQIPKTPHFTGASHPTASWRKIRKQSRSYFKIGPQLKPVSRNVQKKKQPVETLNAIKAEPTSRQLMDVVIKQSDRLSKIYQKEEKVNKDKPLNPLQSLIKRKREISKRSASSRIENATRILSFHQAYNEWHCGINPPKHRSPPSILSLGDFNRDWHTQLSHPI